MKSHTRKFASFFASIAALVALAACVNNADAAPSVLTSPFGIASQTKAQVRNVTPRPTPPYTSTVNPNTNPALYLGMPVLVTFDGYVPEPGVIQSLTTSGYVGTTPMAEQVLFWYTTAMADIPCQIFQTQDEAQAAYTFNNGGNGFICVGWPNPNLL